MKINEIYNMNCLDGLRRMKDKTVDLTVTSPPYGKNRTYKGYVFDFEKIAKEIFRVTKDGGVLVWISCDQTLDGGETGESFKQALFFVKCGFKLTDTMIWNKESSTDTGSLRVRYGNSFEYMFVFTKGKCKTFNPIKDRKNKCAGEKKHGTIRQPDGSMKRQSSIGKIIPEYGQRFNVWNISPEKNNKTGHPAVFPEKLARDHIISWSNEGDIILDPFMGSGTTALAAIHNNRNFIGFEISEEYCEKARQRVGI